MGKPGIAMIAVVDDDHAVCEAMSSLLRSAGYRCATFSSAESFLAWGRTCDFDCILLDVRMPGMSGLDLHQNLIRMNCDIPVIYVTAAHEHTFRERAFSQGAAAFLTKAPDEDALLNAIRAAVSSSGSAGNGQLSRHRQTPV